MNEATKQAAYKMWENLPASSISSYIMSGLYDDDEVCAPSRMKFGLSVVLFTTVRCCMPSMHMTFTVPVACKLQNIISSLYYKFSSHFFHASDGDWHGRNEKKTYSKAMI